ncbi:MAG: anthranilate phosphoribosyltransferase [Phycisphaerales bacterium]|nr:anthranilate phosphoribosyltransferase [Phycisphaerales bacterium]
MSAAPAADLEPLIALAQSRPSLSEDEAHQAFSLIMTGRAQTERIAQLLTVLAQRGPGVDELVGAARVMREHVTRVPVPDDLRDRLIDTCGTGGAPKTFNVSTAAAVVAAGAGAVVAKHGNRSRTGRGSAEVLEHLGVNVNAPPDVQARCLQTAGLSFSFAIHHHPATRHAMPARRSLGFPTIFNLLGPLTNPAGARRQVIGVYAPQFVDLLAQALTRLGAHRAMIVHGCGGLDELSTAGPNQLADCRAGAVHAGRCDPASLGMAPSDAPPPAADVADAARIITEVLSGRPGPHAEMAVLNAAAALVVADLAPEFAVGVAMSRDSIASGKANAALQSLIDVSHSA